MYIERKIDAQSGESSFHGGEAHIGRVTFSRTMRTLYYRGKAFHKYKGGYKYNYWEAESGDYYWISGCKQDGSDRLYGERVPIHIDEDVREEYWTAIRGMPSNAKIKVRYGKQ